MQSFHLPLALFGSNKNMPDETLGIEERIEFMRVG